MANEDVFNLLELEALMTPVPLERRSPSTMRLAYNTRTNRNRDRENRDKSFPRRHIRR